MNTKYFSAEKIIARLQRRFPKKLGSITIGDVIEICAEVEFEVLGTYTGMMRKDGISIKVNNNRATLPCDVFRLKDVYTKSGTRINGFTNNGVYLHFSEASTLRPSDNTEILINYDGIPIDDMGYPLFLRGHEQALEWGCITRLFEEDHMDGKINENTWQLWIQRYEYALASADTGFRHNNRNDMKEFLLLIHDMIPRVTQMHLKHLR